MVEGNRLRVNIIGVVVVSLFCALFARLWYLQSTASEELVSVAQANQVRYVDEPALRGEILDRQGRVLATNRVVDAVTLERGLDEDETEVIVGRLAELLGMPADEIHERLDDPRISPYTPVVIARDVSIETITYLEEHRADFPGVEATRLPVREYVNGSVMAHVIGYTGEISDDELATRGEQGYQLGDRVGKAGIEASYETDLRGQPRRVRIEVDSQGRPVSSEVEREQVPGHDVQLSLDLDVQRVAEAALRQGIETARDQVDRSGGTGYFQAPAGSVVVLDARDGSVVAMASDPTYDPREFTDGIPTDVWERLNDPVNHFPLINRAIQGQYAPGSTFKLISSIAGLESGIVTAGTTINDPGEYQCADTTFRNAGGVANGPVSLPEAVRVSSDVYFYKLGCDLYRRGFNPETVEYTQGIGGDAIQDTARKYGLGSPAGVALPSEAGGRVPDAAWKKAVHEERPDAFPFELWLPGDNVNLAVGQGDFLTTPLQLAEAYATFANGGTLYQPRLVDRVLDDPGNGQPPTLVRDVTSTVKGPTDLNPDHRAAIMSGLAQVPVSGTAASPFSGFPTDEFPIAGKTGTAQVTGKQDTSLFVGITPVDVPQYVVAAVIEEAGFGASIAAPTVRAVIEYLVGLTPSSIDYAAATVD